MSINLGRPIEVTECIVSLSRDIFTADYTSVCNNPTVDRFSGLDSVRRFPNPMDFLMFKKDIPSEKDFRPTAHSVDGLVGQCTIFFAYRWYQPETLH